MTCGDRQGVVVYRKPRAGGEIDAIDAYSRRLVDAMDASGHLTTYVDGGLTSVLADGVGYPRWVVVQYNPFSYGRWGFAPDIVRDAIRVRRRWSRSPLVLSVHEAWVSMIDWRSAVMGAYQRAQLRMLLRIVDGTIVVRERLVRELGGECTHIPVGSNVLPVPIAAEHARRRLGLDGLLVVALFGRRHPSRALDHAEAAIAQLQSAHGPDRICVLNLGSDSIAPATPPGVLVRSPGRLDNDELSMHLRASDLLLLPFNDGLSTRRGTLMAGLAHGLPVVGLEGFNTDRVLHEHPDATVLTPVGDPAAFARAVVRLTHDPGRMRAVGAAGVRLYERMFDWPVIAGKVLDTVQQCSPRLARTGTA